MGQGNSETTPLKVLPVSTDTVLVVCQDEQQMEPPDIDVGAVPLDKRSRCPFNRIHQEANSRRRATGSRRELHTGRVALSS